MELNIVETRGRKRKYDFSKMEVGVHLAFSESTHSVILNCANYYSQKNKLGWKFRAWHNEDGDVVLVRIK